MLDDAGAEHGDFIMSAGPRHWVRRRRSVKRVQVPALATVLERVRVSRLSWDDIATDAGISRDTLRTWFQTPVRDPGFVLVSRVAAVVGLRLVCVATEPTIPVDDGALAAEMEFGHGG